MNKTQIPDINKGGEGAAEPFELSRSKKLAMGIAHAFERTILGPLTPRVNTPSQIVFQWERTTLIRFLTRAEEVHPVPVLIIPPLMVTPDIFDLRPGHSMVEHLLMHKLNVYLLDLGIPTDEDREISMDDYILDFIPEACEKILADGHEEISMVGWSMGGIMSLLYTAIGRSESRVRNVVTIGSPVDFSQMFPFNYLAAIGKVLGGEKILDKIGNIPPFLTRNGFKLMKPVSQILRYRDFVLNLWDRNWVAGYETIKKWIDGFIPYPGEAFKQFVGDFIIDDKLRKGQIYFGDRQVDLSEIRSNILVFVGTNDDIAPDSSVSRVLDFVASEDKTALRVPLGHIGLVAGSGAPALVWEPMARWLEERSGPLRKTQSGISKAHAGIKGRKKEKT